MGMKGTRNILKFTAIALFIMLAILMSSCRTKRYLSEGEYLLKKNVVVCDNKSIDEDNLKQTLNQKPNTRILGILPLKMYVYNLINTGKDMKWKGRISQAIGEEPVIYDSEATEKSVSNIKTYMATQSYYQSDVTVKEKVKRNRKVKIKYRVSAGPSYKISSIKYDIENKEIGNLLFLDTAKSCIKIGSAFNTDSLKAERERITRLFKLNGYYYFSTNNIHFYADTLKGDNKVDLILSIQSNENDIDDAFQRQEIRNVSIFSNYDLNTDDASSSINMFQRDGIKFVYDKKITHNTSVLLQSCFFKPGDTYSVKNVEDTYSRLSSLKQFRLINIKLVPPSADEILLEGQSKRLLDANIYLAPMKRQSFSVELEGSNTSGNFGMAGVLSYKNRNIFKGAQIFSAKANISFQTMSFNDSIATEKKLIFFNTFEYGGELKLTFPKLLVPFFKNIEFVKKHNPQTQISLSYNYQSRPDYSRSITKLDFGYIWTGSKNKYLTHKINPLELYLVKIFTFSEDFMNRIQNLYIKYSYENQFLMVCSYDLVFNNQNLNTKRDFSYFWMNLETCGNLLHGIYSLSNAAKDDGSYKFLGIEFAQYIKADFDYRFYDIINEKNSIIYRAFFGIGFPYGNSTKGLPFVKRYFIGGANDIRAWQVRTIGPGSYKNDIRNYDQIADMKLMFNIEYRFTMVSFLQGALFVDGGNIWAIDKNDNREGAMFSFKNFYKQIALGTGFGIRLDFQFLVLRFDVGIPVYNPSLDDGDRWFESFSPFKLRKFTLNFGIGYPF
ncbi:MAG: BamA/TamA family outer membrane protein [Bacteroidales bacterium]|nr:BamA/TamA family outer membrane protein [Bacteroidales bacterium]